jgi:hypothetical protein
MGVVRRDVVREGWCRVRDWTSERRIAFLGRAARMVEGKVRARRARKMEGVVALRRIVLEAAYGAAMGYVVCVMVCVMVC